MKLVRLPVRGPRLWWYTSLRLQPSKQLPILSLLCTCFLVYLQVQQSYLTYMRTLGMQATLECLGESHGYGLSMSPGALKSPSSRRPKRDTPVH